MKTGLLLLFLSTGGLLSGAEPAQPVAASLADVPAEITQFYHDVNFAACFSTHEERKFVSYMIRQNKAARLPERLRTVAEAVQRISVASTSIDSQIVRQTGTWDSPAEELTEIASVSKDGDRIRVEVRVRVLQPKTRSWLVSHYEDATSKKDASADLPFVLAETMRQKVRTEIHQWIQSDGRWVRKEVGIVLLNSAR